MQFKFPGHSSFIRKRPPAPTALPRVMRSQSDQSSGVDPSAGTTESDSSDSGGVRLGRRRRRCG